MHEQQSRRCCANVFSGNLGQGNLQSPYDPQKNNQASENDGTGFPAFPLD